MEQNVYTLLKQVPGLDICHQYTYNALGATLFIVKKAVEKGFEWLLYISTHFVCMCVCPHNLFHTDFILFVCLFACR